MAVLNVPMTGSEFVTVELFLASSDRSHHADELAYWSSAVGDLVATADARAVVHDSTALGGLAHGDETASAPTFVALLANTRNCPTARYRRRWTRSLLS